MLQPQYLFISRQLLKNPNGCSNIQQIETEKVQRKAKMVGLPYDCLANPLGAVRLTFEKAVASGSDPATLDGKDWGAAELFRQFLFDDGGLSQVPMLNQSTIKWVQPNTLVRFRGMIQDMLGNEYYVGAYKDGDMWRTNKFADTSWCPMDASSDMRIWERRLLYCVPIPGQNTWVESCHEAVRNPYTNSVSPQREKRQRDDDATMSDVDMVVEPSPALEDSPNPKKMREDGMALEPLGLQKIAAEGNLSTLSLVPDAETNSLPCLVKIYDFPESDLKLNDVFEFVGIFTFDPDLTVDRDENDELTDNFCEDTLIYLPPTKVPRLHCVVHRKLVGTDFLSNPQLELTPCVIKEVREALLGHLTVVLGNDRVAAQYLLLHLLSRKIKITCSPVCCIIFGMLTSIGNGYVCAGTLDSVGCENARVLKNMMDLQKVEYDFTYYKMEMAADVQLLILSEGKSNILPADLVLPFRPSSVDSALGVDGEMLKAWRWYLAAMKSLSHSIEPHMQKVVEDDLVAARQADRSLGSQEFSRWLTIGRLMSVSFGETCLSMEHWQMVRELERLRKERLLGNM
ncbi:UNVERIFIED_CONTAM: Mini-chromosome maintenance complex-binding protein [Sesamum radiatum]|uniref:Mini-chromosome maintenance complex-binding protein n=1 Tax=Sesamum radiatum TaxID=300843 RepID=A0AAW2NE86_SESRA